MSSGTEVVFNTIVPPGLTPFLEQLYQSGFAKRGGKIICTYFDENFLNLVPAEQVEGLYSCLDWYQELSDRQSQELLQRYNARFPGSAMLTSGSGCTGHYRAIKLWEAAVREARTVDRDAVIRALDHARIAEGPGGPAEVVPGQHHVRMNMYIAQAQGGRFRIVKNLGPIDPKERVLAAETGDERRGLRPKRKSLFFPTSRGRSDAAPGTNRLRKSNLSPGEPERFLTLGGLTRGSDSTRNCAVGSRFSGRADLHPPC